MLQPNPTLTALFAQEFAWCQVQPGQTAAILTEPDSSAQYLGGEFDEPEHLRGAAVSAHAAR